MRTSKHAAAALVAAIAIVASAPNAGAAQLTIGGPSFPDIRDRERLRLGDGPTVRDTDVVRTRVFAFDTIPEGDLALLGCDVLGPDGPEVLFLQVADGTGVLSTTPELVGESCAQTLNELLGNGLEIDDTRTVTQPIGGGGTLEILVWVLIRQS